MTITTPVSPQNISSETLKNISDTIGVNSSDINYVGEKNISTTAPQATTGINNAVSDDGYVIYKSVATVSGDKTGHYIMKIDIPSSLIGSTIKNVKIYFVNRSIFTSGNFVNSATEGLTTAMILGTDGKAVETLPTQVYADANLLANTNYDVYIATLKTSPNSQQTQQKNSTGTLGSSGGGCEMGIGIFGVVFALGSLLIFKRS